MTDASAERQELSRQIADRRRELQLAVGDLRTAAARWRDPRAYVRARPLPWLVGAALGGFWLGSRRR